MVRTKKRSLSPTGQPDVKRTKRAHLSSTSDPGILADPTPHFAPELLEPPSVQKLHNEYANSQPFKYCRIEKLFQDSLLAGVKDECLSELSFTEKETDIYKVNQTGDLASLSYLTEAQIALLPNLLKLRDALYSSTFRRFLQAVTGCGPLSGTKQDMSVNTYTKGCHLLNHDDVIGSRRVSYILYMPLPHYQGWQAEWGGALEMYPVKPGADGVLEPEPIPSVCIPPSWNQFIFFEVQPGKSFHSVEEVVVGEGEDGRQRLSISGWFHAAQPGEEGYDPDEGKGEYKSSREQLVSSQTDFKSYPEDEDPPLPSESLSSEHVSFLSEFLNPVYLQPRTMSSLAERFALESSLELHSFLCEPLAAKLELGLAAHDARDGLGPDRTHRIPPHTAGTSLASQPPLPPADVPSSSSSSSSTPSSSSPPSPPSPTPAPIPWQVKGPPHKWRYCTLAPRLPGGKREAVVPRSAQTNVDGIVRCLQDELFPSQAFRAWLAQVSSVLPMRHAVEARRFRPGLDYTLATSEDREARLDVVLGLTAEVGATEESGVVRGWQSGEWGGWECYMAPHEEEDDPAVYRSGSSNKKPPTKANGSASHAPAKNGAHTNGSQQNSPARNGHGNGKARQEEVTESDEEDAEEDEDEDGTLLTVQPGFNRLLLVLRDEKVMRFVKYVSAAADGSRWDVCGEYEVGMIEEDEE